MGKKAKKGSSLQEKRQSAPQAKEVIAAQKKKSEASKIEIGKTAGHIEKENPMQITLRVEEEGEEMPIIEVEDEKRPVQSVQAEQPQANNNEWLKPDAVQASLSSIDQARVLEAALFMASQPLATSDLAKLVGIAAMGFVDEKLDALAREYDGKKSAIEVVKEESGKWAMRVRATYAPSVRGFAGEAEISRHALKTLAYISKNEGIKKRDLFKRLGSSIYENVAELVEKGFVAATPAGRTVSLKTTAKFRQYFEA